MNRPGTREARPLNVAGRLLEAKLTQLGLTKTDLRREINRRRAAVGITIPLAPVTLRRWTASDERMRSPINLDDAVLIELICGVPAALWSKHHRLAAATNEPVG